MTDQSDLISSTTAPTQEVVTETVVPQATPVTTPTVDTYQSQLSTIKNEDGLQKYANVNDALTGAGHAQEFIKTLKSEAATREEEVTLLRAELANAQSQAAPTPEVQPTAVPAVGREDVYSYMKDYESSKVRESNRKSVIDTLVNHCNGDQVKASEMIQNRLTEMGMTRDQLGTLSETSPKAVYELMQIEPKGTSSVAQATSGTIRAEAVEMSNQNKAVPRRKALPIGASTQHLLDEYRAAKAEILAN